MVALFLAALLAVSALIRWAAPVPHGGGLAVKLAAYEELAHEIDVVVLGTSRLARGVIPEVLDAELAAHGRPLKSFNLSVLGMGALEADYVLDQVLALGAGRLQTVLLEVDSWRPVLPDDELGLRARDVHWHDLSRTRTALESLWQVRQFSNPLQLVELAGIELERLALDQLSIGRLAWWLGEGFAPNADPLDSPTPSEALRLRGHHPYPVAQSDGLLRQQANARRRGEPSRFERLLNQARRPTVRDRDTSTYNRDALQRQIERVRAVGVTPIYLAPPSVKSRAWIATLAEEGALPALLDFRDPNAHPELFAFERRYDVDHLNQDGAELFSRELAAALHRQLSLEEHGDAAR
ncbi:MAG: hypothetical protein DHS20C15_06850 [Planctomycetota bacterium]|nr:MAG: hypothetical protein DHS20C15_06850 [Planctomycetota bacterium]